MISRPADFEPMVFVGFAVQPLLSVNQLDAFVLCKKQTMKIIALFVRLYL